MAGAAANSEFYLKLGLNLQKLYLSLQLMMGKVQALMRLALMKLALPQPQLLHPWQRSQRKVSGFHSSSINYISQVDYITVSQTIT